MKVWGKKRRTTKMLDGVRFQHQSQRKERIKIGDDKSDDDIYCSFME